jgi:hypothetical protein
LKYKKTDIANNQIYAMGRSVDLSVKRSWPNLCVGIQGVFIATDMEVKRLQSLVLLGGNLEETSGLVFYTTSCIFVSPKSACKN